MRCAVGQEGSSRGGGGRGGRGVHLGFGKRQGGSHEQRDTIMNTSPLQSLVFLAQDLGMWLLLRAWWQDAKPTLL